jgi:phosphoglycolate phosphatase
VKNISLIIYDFDGTLVDTLGDIALAVNLTLRELQLMELPVATIQQYVGHGVDNLMRQSLHDASEKAVKQAVQLFRKHYGEHLTDQTDFYPHGRDILNFFSDRKQAICSNKPEDFVHRILAELKAEHYFFGVVGGDTVETKKPDPQGLLKLIATAGVSADQTLMVGDSVVDIQAGKAAGTKTCVVTFGNGDPEEMRRCSPDIMIDSLADLINFKEETSPPKFS